MFQLLLDLLLATIMGLAFTGGGMAGVALRDRLLSIDQPPTIQAPIFINIRPPPPPPPFMSTCPFALPVQLRYSPLACTMHEGPLALIRPYGFVPIASNHLHRLKPNPWRQSPQPRTEQLAQPPSPEDLPSRTPVKGLLARLVRSTWRAFKTIVIWTGFAHLVAFFAMVVYQCLNLFMARRNEYASIKRQDELDLEFARLTLENALAADALQQVANRLEQRVAECKRYRPAASGLNRCRREAAFFEDTTVQLVESLALFDPENDLVMDILENEDDFPVTVANEPEARALPAAAHSAVVPYQPP